MLFLSLGLISAQPICIEWSSLPRSEPYLHYALLRSVEKAVLESGYSLGCDGEYEKLSVKVRKFEEVPIAYTPAQRVSVYNLILSLEAVKGNERFIFTVSVPYSLPSGGLGDLPRRKAIDDLLDKIYLRMVEKLRRWRHADKRGDGKER